MRVSYTGGRIYNLLQLRHTIEKVGQGDARAFGTGIIIRLAKKSVDDGFNFQKASENILNKRIYGGCLQGCIVKINVPFSRVVSSFYAKTFRGGGRELTIFSKTG